MSKNHRFAVCGKCKCKRIVHDNPRAINNDNVGSCRNCDCKKYEVSLRPITRRDMIYFCLVGSSLVTWFMFFDLIGIIPTAITSGTLLGFGVIYYLYTKKLAIEADIQANGGKTW